MSRPPRAAPERLAGKCAADAVNASAAIVAAIATSELTPSEASSVSGVIQNFTKTIETAELEERIRRLEKPPNDPYNSAFSFGGNRPN
jgi:hypothetical protein